MRLWISRNIISAILCRLWVTIHSYYAVISVNLRLAPLSPWLRSSLIQEIVPRSKIRHCHPEIWALWQTLNAKSRWIPWNVEPMLFLIHWFLAWFWEYFATKHVVLSSEFSGKGERIMRSLFHLDLLVVVRDCLGLGFEEAFASNLLWFRVLVPYPLQLLERFF